MALPQGVGGQGRYPNQEASRGTETGIGRFQAADQRLEEFDVTVTVRRATLGDESKRMAALFADGDTALITDIAIVETWIAINECDIVGPDDEPLLQPGMDYETFAKNLTAVWQYSAELFWAIHGVVREANPQWAPPSEEDEATEGNE